MGRAGIHSTDLLCPCQHNNNKHHCHKVIVVSGKITLLKSRARGAWNFQRAVAGSVEVLSLQESRGGPVSVS